MLNYRFDKREKLQRKRLMLSFVEGKTRRGTTEKPQQLFLVKAARITFLEKKKKCPCFLAKHLVLFLGTWQKGIEAGNQTQV